MVDMAQDMDKADKSTIFSRLNPAKFEHFKPLSVYSRMITCDQKATQNCDRLCSPFINFKVEIVNNCAKKRKLDDSGLDETPAKKANKSQAVSPDLGCFMDSSSPLARQEPESPFALYKQTVSAQLHSTHVECGSSTQPGDNGGAMPDTSKHERPLFNTVPAFDCDVDDILCLNPFGADPAEGLPDDVAGFKSPRDSMFQNKPDLIPTVVRSQELGRGDGQVEEREEAGQKEKQLNVEKDVEEDKGYFSMSYLCPIVSGSPLESVKCPVEPLDGDVEEPWNIGLPIFESSVCHNVTVKLNADAGVEPSREVSELVAAPVRECQATLSGGETTLDTSYETTLPLQVQLKSVVVAPHLIPSSSKPAAAPPLLKQTVRLSSAKSQRPPIFPSEADLECQKRSYIHSVTKHVNENPKAEDVMSELLNLMTSVAGQAPGNSNAQWQHPSDLTRRNYRKRFGSATPMMTLHEWQMKNRRSQRRFENLPKIFERSPLP